MGDGAALPTLLLSQEHISLKLFHRPAHAPQRFAVAEMAVRYRIRRRHQPDRTETRRQSFQTQRRMFPFALRLRALERFETRLRRIEKCTAQLRDQRGFVAHGCCQRRIDLSGIISHHRHD